MRRDIRGKGAFDRCRNSAGPGKFSRIQIVGIQPYLDWTCLTERPVVQTSTEVEGNAPAIGGIQLTVRETRARWVCIDLSPQSPPLCIVQAKVGSRELSVEMRRRHRTAHCSFEIGCSVQTERLRTRSAESVGYFFEFVQIVGLKLYLQHGAITDGSVQLQRRLRQAEVAVSQRDRLRRVRELRMNHAVDRSGRGAAVSWSHRCVQCNINVRLHVIESRSP